MLNLKITSNNYVLAHQFGVPVLLGKGVLTRGRNERNNEINVTQNLLYKREKSIILIRAILLNHRNYIVTDI